MSSSKNTSNKKTATVHYQMSSYGVARTTRKNILDSKGAQKQIKAAKRILNNALESNEHHEPA